MADKNGGTTAKWVAAIIVAVSVTINVFLGVSVAAGDRDRGKIEENTKAIYGLQITIEYLSEQVKEAIGLYRGE